MDGVWLRGSHKKDTGRVESTHRDTLQSTIGNGGMVGKGGTVNITWYEIFFFALFLYLEFLTIQNTSRLKTACLRGEKYPIKPLTDDIALGVWKIFCFLLALGAGRVFETIRG